MIAIVLLAIIFLVALSQTTWPVRSPATGREIASVVLGWRPRLVRQRRSLLAIGLVLVLATVLGWVTWPVYLLGAVLAASLVALPVRYRFTTSGVDVNGVVARSWSCFDGYAVDGMRVHLHGFAQFDLWLTKAQQAEVLALLPHRLTSTPPPRGMTVRG